MSLLITDRQYLVYPDCVDGRLGKDGLSGIVRNELGRDPRNGHVFIFVNRTRRTAKLLYWETGGTVLHCKYIDLGTFQVPMGRADGQAYTISEAQMLQLLRGVVFQKERRPKQRGGDRLELER